MGLVKSQAPCACASFAVELDAICNVDHAIEHRIGERRKGADVVPAVERRLTGDQGRAGHVESLDDFRRWRVCSGSSGSGTQSSSMSRLTRES